MMRHPTPLTALVLASSISMTFSTSVFAQATETVTGEMDGTADSFKPKASTTIGAFPGTFRVPSAAAIPEGLALALTAGYGYFEDVLQLEDSHHRMRGSFAGSLRLTPGLALGARVNGRYDRHRGAGALADDGYVGEGRLTLHAATDVTPTLGLGLQATAWIPDISGVSAELSGLATLKAGPMSVTANAGFRLDRSGDAVENADMLSRSDRLALGASDSNAVLLALAVAVPVGSVDLFLEGTWDLLIGEDAPALRESPLRVGFGVSSAISDSYRVTATIEGSFGRVPFVDVMQPLVPVEPLVALNISLLARALGGTRPQGLGQSAQMVEPKNVPVTDPKAARDSQAGLGGTVRDQQGQPISGAVVQIADREVITADAGTFVAESLAPGEITVSVSADGFVDARETVVIGDDKVREINIILKKRVVGILRGVVQGFSGEPVAATIVVVDSDGKEVASIESAADGRFDLKLAPGDYKATATATGFRAKSTSFTLEVPGPVVILNLDLRPEKPGKKPASGAGKE